MKKPVAADEVRIEAVGGLLALYVPWGEDWWARIRQVPERRWDSLCRRWTVLDTPRARSEVLEAFRGVVAGGGIREAQASGCAESGELSGRDKPSEGAHPGAGLIRVESRGDGLLTIALPPRPDWEWVRWGRSLPGMR